MKCVDSMDFEQYKGVCVLAELRKGELIDASVELVSEGRVLANEMGCGLTAIVLGKDVGKAAKLMAGYGADKIIACESPLLENYNTCIYTKAVCHIVEKLRPDVFLISATTTGRALAPRCAARLHTGLNADCTLLHSSKQSYMNYLAENSQLNLNEIEGQVDERGLKMTMPAFGGSLMATIICPQYRPQMATVRPGVMRAGKFDREKANNAVVEYVDCGLREDDIRSTIAEIIANTGETVDLTKAEVIVAVGRGIFGNPEKGVALANELAELLGGNVGATREVVSAGWMDESLMIGQTGKIVRPKLYVALGVSGAIQHVGGMKDSDFVIAVNKDKNAPIFELADYGLAGDLFEIVPQIIAQVKKANAQPA